MPIGAASTSIRNAKTKNEIAKAKFPYGSRDTIHACSGTTNRRLINQLNEVLYCCHNDAATTRRIITRFHGVIALVTIVSS